MCNSGLQILCQSDKKLALHRFVNWGVWCVGTFSAIYRAINQCVAWCVRKSNYFFDFLAYICSESSNTVFHNMEDLTL